MTITMLLSALLLLTVAALLFTLSALHHTRQRLARGLTQLQAYKDKLESLWLPKVRIGKRGDFTEAPHCTAVSYEWAPNPKGCYTEVSVGDHLEALYVVTHHADDGSPSQYGQRILNLLRQHSGAAK